MKRSCAARKSHWPNSVKTDVHSITWSEAAARDYDELLQFIARESPANARLVATRILKTLGMLEAFSLGQPIGEGVYRLYIPKTSYFVLFRRN